MIIKPANWNINYLDLSVINYRYDVTQFIKEFIKNIKIFLNIVQVQNLAYSGGIDSTIMLALMTEVYRKVSTFTIASREDHPDVVFSELGCSKYDAERNLFIPTCLPDRTGDTAVKMFFNNTKKDSMITCDAIDEFMCGYYSHQSNPSEKYVQHIKELVPNHLIPLDKNSGDVKVYLPYLDPKLVRMMASIPLQYKVDKKERKKVIVEIARHLKLPEEIITRNKYGFCDALSEVNK